MKISVDISNYPLHDEFKIPIRDFINRLNMHPQVKAVTNGMSTQVFGEYDDVMKALNAEMKKSFEIPHSVFVLKIVNADLQQ
jgi:uncharacterized protein YqgV (UPF0045/DUF77 family)